jgi:hypothetical protein
MQKLYYYPPLVAAVMLLGLGIYYFIFEPMRFGIWIMLLLGAVMNMYIAWRLKEQGKQE